MAIPVYLWLKDDGGADIKGSVDVQDRDGSIEVVAQEHNLYIPTDNNTGKLTGTRIHTPFLFTKEIDSSSPYLYKAVPATVMASFRMSQGIFWMILRVNVSSAGRGINALIPDNGPRLLADISSLFMFVKEAACQRRRFTRAAVSVRIDLHPQAGV